VLLTFIYFNLGSARIVGVSILNNITNIIQDNLFIGKGYGFVNYAEQFNATLIAGKISPDHSFILLLIYELGFIPIFVICSIFSLLKNNNHLFLLYFALSSAAVANTSNIFYYLFVIMFVKNIIDSRNRLIHSSRTRILINKHLLNHEIR